MIAYRTCFSIFALLALSLSSHAHENAPPLRVYGNTTTIELAPVLLASDRVYAGRSSVSNGGIPNLFVDGEADIATNAETQALRLSADHPNLRIIFTVSEGFYRIVARRSAGIGKLSDLRGKRIATIPRTSSAYYLHKMLASVGLTEADVTIVPIFPLDRMPPALKNGEVDAVTIWEPEIQNAADLIGADAIEFQDRSVYRELFNLNTTAEALADPERRCAIVSYVRSLVTASERINKENRQVLPLVAKSGGYDAKLLDRVWHHEGYPGTLVKDLLDVMVDEEVWVAKERDRTPRSREQLASLIDSSVLQEAVASDGRECVALLASAPKKRDENLAALQQRVEQLALKVDGVEALRAVKRIQYAYGQYFEAGKWSDIADLFASKGTAREGDTSVSGKSDLRKHWLTRFGQGKSGPVAGRLHSTLFVSPVVTMDPDAKTVRARWHALNMTGEYGRSASWAGGIYENEYIKEGGVWKIGNERYYPQYAGPYETGWRDLVRESGKTQPVPYHYDPTRAGTPIPEATAPASSKPLTFDKLAARLGELRYRTKQLNDASVVQNLQHAYGFYFDRKMWDDVADLFVSTGTMELGQQGVYVGRANIRRALEQFGPPGLRDDEVNDNLQLQPVITVAPDGRSAKARGTQLRMTGVNLKGAQWGLDVYENTYVKDIGVWRIASMRVYPRMTTDYYKGWATDAAVAFAPSAQFPADRPPSAVVGSYPKAGAVPFDYASPVAKPVDIRARAVDLRPRTAMELQAAVESAERKVMAAEAYDGAENVSNAYGYYIDEFLWNETADLFSLNGKKELSYIGTYVGRDRIRDSMVKRYGLNGRRANSLVLHQKTQPVISVADDGLSARIRSRLFQINSATDADGSYISGIYENSIVRENGAWKISAMDLDYVWTTSYTAGWAKVSANDAQRFAPQPTFAKEYPPDGPLRGVIYAPFPKIAETAFHYRNPASGRAPPLLLQ
ncbi:MAG: nuclear transport factor 2 family protein [Steroidobacteraceae bacterium]